MTTQQIDINTIIIPLTHKQQQIVNIGLQCEWVIKQADELLALKGK